jgi:hypothetical protein
METDKFNKKNNLEADTEGTKEIMSVAEKIAGHINQVESSLSDRIKKSEVRITNLEEQAKR